MDNLKNVLPSQDSTTGRGLKVTLFATSAAFIAFSTGFINALNTVPGCSQVVLDWIQANALQLSLYIGVPAGAFSFIWNLLRDKVKNY